MDGNIDDFNQAVYAILTTLHRQLPIPIRLDVAELIRTDDLLSSEMARREHRLTVYGATVDYLRTEGFLRYDERSATGQRFEGVQMTGRGLSALARHGLPDAQERHVLRLFS